MVGPCTPDNTCTSSSSPDMMASGERCGLTVVWEDRVDVGEVMQGVYVLAWNKDDPAVCVSYSCQPTGQQAANGMPSGVAGCMAWW